jgi:signal transduction histidine kinase
MTFDGLIPSEANQHSTSCARDFARFGGAPLQTDNTRRGRIRARRHRPAPQPPAAHTDSRGEERLAERTRIAQELHDTLLQGFCAVSMQLEAEVNHLPADSTAKSRFSNLVQLVHRVLEEGRLAVQGLRSPQQDERSLGHALAGVPTLLGLPLAANFRVVVEGRQRELKAALRDEIYRIGREAIVNAHRHSGARDIETQIVFRPTELRVTVRDNGRGMDTQDLEAGRTGHWGLQGMRERARRIGAHLRVLSRTAIGTEVELCVPGRIAFEQSPAAC